VIPLVAAAPRLHRSRGAAAITALARRREAGPLSGTAAKVPAKYADTVYLVRHAVNVNDVNI